MIRFRSRLVDGLSVQPGPTRSGGSTEQRVGGVVLPTVNYLVLGMVALFVLGMAFLLYKKRDIVIRFFAPTLLRLMRI